MNNSQTSSNNQTKADTTISEKRSYSSWSPPESFSITSEKATIFLVDREIGRHKQAPQPFSLAPMNVEESLALSAWGEEENTKTNTRGENFTDKNSISSYSSDTNTVNTYDDDTASVTTCSTTTTTTTSTSDFPPVIHITMKDLIRRKSMQDNINNYNNNYNTISATTTNNNYKGKQKLVNFKDEIVESGRPLRNSIDLSPPSIISNDSSTVRDNNSIHQEEISEISVTPSLGLSRISKQEFEAARLDKQKSLRAWVKCLWPQPRLPTPRQLTNGLNARTLSKRNLNPLIIGAIVTHKSVPMISTAIVKGTRHSMNRIGENGQIKFVGEPELSKGFCDPREYILLHCPTYHNLPFYNDDPRVNWNDNFLLNKVLPRLADEATRIQNEVGLYLTVRETCLRGFGKYPLYQCKMCPTHYTRKFTYEGIHKHLTNNHNHENIKQIHDEEMIKVDIREYISFFYKNNLPPKDCI
jgi:hypothetical protein